MTNKKPSKYELKKAKKKAREEAEANAITQAALKRPSSKFILCGCAELPTKVKEGSVDIIITDPPYPKEFLSTYSDLSYTAEKILKPGGLCVAMAGQSWLPEVMQRLGEHLEYHWLGAYFTPGGSSAQVWPRKVLPRYKPLLIYRKKGEYTGKWFSDVATSPAKNQTDAGEFHKWGQTEAGMRDIVLRFTEPGDTVCDPFLGSGTTAICLEHNRPFIGCDVDTIAVETSKERYSV